MPPPSGQNLLKDIIGEITFLFDATSSGAMDAYPGDPMVKRGIERSVEIVCEATRQLRVHRPDIASQITEVGQIIGMRHRLAHGYSRIDTDVVIATIRFSLPTLLDEAERLLVAELP